MAEELRRSATRRTSDGRRSSREERQQRTSRTERQARQHIGLRERWDGVLDGMRSNSRPLLVVAVILAFVVMLYAPVRGYYVARRSNEDLRRYLEAVSQQNELLKDDLGRLQSEEGIEDEARRRGWVKEDEVSVIVDGLPDADLAAMLGDIELEDNRPWYVKALDAVFFYRENSWQ